MGKQFPSLDASHRDFIRRQRIFFAASAAPGARVNVSPRGTDAFAVIDERTVAYLDRTGSGNETAAHLKADGRLTIMFCAFDGPPNILRLYGRGEALRRGSRGLRRIARERLRRRRAGRARARSSAFMSTLRADVLRLRNAAVRLSRRSAPRSTTGRGPKGEDGLEAYRRRRTSSASTACRPGSSTKSRTAGVTAFERALSFGWAPAVGSASRVERPGCSREAPARPRRRLISGPRPMLDMPDLPIAGADYAIVKRAIEFLSTRWRDQPSIEAVAGHVGLSASHFQHVFKRWAGLTPKAFLQAITIERARERLRIGERLDAAYDVGLSGPSRLHDLFVAHESLTPGDYRRDDLVSLRLPRLSVWRSDRGHCPARPGGPWLRRRWRPGRSARDMRRAGPGRSSSQTNSATALAARALSIRLWRPETPLRIVMIGTDFEVRVWETLLSVPMGAATTYSDIALKIGRPKAARAVGAAVGRNPISFVVPCHRVLGRSGALTGYHWGLARKQAIIGWEAGRDRAA